MHVSRRLSRRTALRGAAVAIGLPLLDAMIPRRVFGASAAAVAPKRLVAINIPLGFYPDKFFPQETGENYALSPYLEPAAKLRSRFTVVSGTSHPDVDGGHSAEKSFLTTAPRPGDRSFKNSISLDQFAAKQIGTETRFASLTLGEISLSWSATGVALPAINSPAEACAKLFLAGSPDEVAQQRRRLEDGQSVLDVVLADANAMQRTLGATDRAKLDQYFSAVRETERDLVKQQAWSTRPKPAIDAKPPGQIPSKDVTGKLKAHFEVVRLALATDSTRVATVGGNGGSEVAPLPGVTQGYHGLSHHGKNPQLVAELEIVDRATMQAWADFLISLAETPDGDADLLSRTQVLLGSNLGNANAHSTTNLPIVLAGGGGHAHGKHLAFDAKNNEPLGNLFVSMLQDLGLDADRFGSGTATLRGLA